MPKVTSKKTGERKVSMHDDLLALAMSALPVNSEEFNISRFKRVRKTYNSIGLLHFDFQKIDDMARGILNKRIILDMEQISEFNRLMPELMDLMQQMNYKNEPIDACFYLPSKVVISLNAHYKMCDVRQFYVTRDAPTTMKPTTMGLSFAMCEMDRLYELLQSFIADSENSS